MPLQRIAAQIGGADSAGRADWADRSIPTSLASEAIRLPAGQQALNRKTDRATALIVAEGALAIGTEDDNDTLSAGDGVLLDADTVYSLVAEDDALALLFSVPDGC